MRSSPAHAHCAGCGCMQAQHVLPSCIGLHHSRLRRVAIPGGRRVVRKAGTLRVLVPAAPAGRRRHEARVRQHARKLAPHVGQHVQRLPGQQVLLGVGRCAGAPALRIQGHGGRVQGLAAPAPGRRIQGKGDDAAVMQCIIALTRQHGRHAVAGESRQKGMAVIC